MSDAVKIINNVKTGLNVIGLLNGKLTKNDIIEESIKLGITLSNETDNNKEIQKASVSLIKELAEMSNKK